MKLIRRGKTYLIAGLCGVCLLALGVWVARSAAQTPRDPPEASKVLAVQAGMPFQILIPAFLPADFVRGNLEIQVNHAGPGGEPMALLTYRTRSGKALFIQEWVPINPDMEILANSTPVNTKWGKAWLLALTDNSLIALWVDIGPLRASIYTHDLNILPLQRLLQVTETMGPASSQQVFSFAIATPVILAMAPPPPVEIPINAQGVQEMTLVVTPGGYDPLRFSVKAGVPVRLTFRQLGQVGCGNQLSFPSDPSSYSTLQLDTEKDQKVLEFTPQHPGDFEYYCSHHMYRGVMTVRQ